MDKITIKNIMGFMMRVQLIGEEVPAFNEAMKHLDSELRRANDQKEHDAEVEHHAK